MSTTESNIERCLRQYRSHTRTLRNGDKVVALPGNVYDLFSGMGWKNRIRFRIIRKNVIGGSIAKVEQLSGLEATQAMEQMILNEVA